MFVLLQLLFLTTQAEPRRLLSDAINGLRLLPKASFPPGTQACLDGSPPGYWLDMGKTDTDKWMVHIEGGGWCFTEDECRKRTSTSIGSSSGWPKATHCYDSCDGILSTNSTQNPGFYGWNHAFVGYCDGSSWTSDHPDPVNGLYYRGKANLDAVFLDLLDRGMNNATEVVLTGGSAGGLTVYLWADYIGSLLSSGTKYRALADAGWFLDHATIKNETRYRDEVIEGLKLWNSLGHLKDSCLTRWKGEPWRCFFAENVVEFIQTELFIAEGMYDSWQMGNILATGCAVPPFHPKGECKTNTAAYADVIAYGKYMRDSILDRLKPTTGVFLSACYLHVSTIMEIKHTPWTDTKVFGLNPQQTFYQWYHGKGVGRSIDTCNISDGKTCNPTCPIFT